VSRTVVAIMARSPDREAHTIKTRLSSIISDPDARVSLYRAFVDDTVRMVRRLSAVELRLAYTPEGGCAGFEAFGIARHESLAQRGSGLGERLRHLYEDLAAPDVSAAIVIGSDSPGFPPAAIELAREQLAQSLADLAIAPTADGGYYLLGLSSDSLTGGGVPDLFSHVRWSTAWTLGDTLAAAGSLGLRAYRCSSWFDVDDEVGWQQLIEALKDPEVVARAPATWRVVSRISAGFSS
jgi:glycosyltransferase A (GT-A) superfamily protein (DUF2064 family)